MVIKTRAAQARDAGDGILGIPKSGARLSSSAQRGHSTTATNSKIKQAPRPKRPVKPVEKPSTNIKPAPKTKTVAKPPSTGTKPIHISIAGKSATTEGSQQTKSGTPASTTIKAGHLMSSATPRTSSSSPNPTSSIKTLPRRSYVYTPHTSVYIPGMSSGQPIKLTNNVTRMRKEIANLTEQIDTLNNELDHVKKMHSDLLARQTQSTGRDIIDSHRIKTRPANLPDTVPVSDIIEEFAHTNIADQRITTDFAMDTVVPGDQHRVLMTDSCIQTDEEWPLLTMSLFDTIATQQQKIREMEKRKKINKKKNINVPSRDTSSAPSAASSSSPIASAIRPPHVQPITSTPTPVPGNTAPLESGKHTNQHQDIPSSSGHCKRQLLVIGDSMSRDLGSLLTPLLPGFTVTSHTYPGATFAQVVKDLPSLTTSFTKEDFVFVLAGTNDVPYFYPSLIDKNLESIKCVFDKSNVIVSCIPYMHHKEGRRHNTNIFASNQYLLRMSSVHNYLLFNANFFLSRGSYTKHGLHLNYNGKYLLSEKLSNNLIGIIIGKNPVAGVLVWGGTMVSNNDLVDRIGDQADGTVWLDDISCPLTDRSEYICSESISMSTDIDIDYNVSADTLMAQFFPGEYGHC
uniref:SGNH hydrolase-type esterase domain-containing protein n=1 Tax=Cacopsylla melanoneura TaxID=428564 RepID=A0A8D8XB95_9HEMI